ncbi:DUF3267 domain-containing protein [Clostridium sp. DL1XJH146]
MSFKVSWKLHVISFVFTLTVCLLLQDSIDSLFISLIYHKIIINITGNILVNFCIFIIVIFVPITVVHELLHGAAYKLFGGKVKYGFKFIYAYAQEISGMALDRTRFDIVLLVPVTFITIGSAFIPGSIGDIVFLLNLVGSTGDLLMALYLCRGNENSYIIEREYGFDMIDIFKDGVDE